MKDGVPSAALVAINAQYIHTGLGVRSIAAYVRRETDFPLSVMEFTINNHEEDVLAALYQSGADVYLFSCYIWNIEMVLRLARDLRQLCPGACIGLGGPQVRCNAEAVLLGEPAIDLIMTGEGEETVCSLLRLLKEGKPLAECNDIAYRDQGRVVQTPASAPMPMDALAFAYPDIGALANRVLYYESMRGCPFACSYCASSIEHGVRRRSLPLVFDDLSIFLKHRVPRVKLVDRTFNCDRAHAHAIWSWLIAHDNGVTNFHFDKPKREKSR